MEEHLNGKRWWILLGVLAVIGLCAVLAFGAVAMIAFRPAVTVPVVPQVVPPSGGQGTVPQPYIQPGLPAWGMHRGLGLFGLLAGLFRLLLTVLLIGLLVRFLFRLIGWRRGCWGHRAWGGPWGGPPPDQAGGHGPWGWHHHGGPWGWQHHGGPWGSPHTGSPHTGPRDESGRPGYPPDTV